MLPLKDFLLFRDQRFDRRVVERFYRVLAAALLVLIVEEMLAGQWHVHAGDLCGRAFPLASLPAAARALLGGLPWPERVYSTRWLIAEWGLLALSAVGILAGRARRHCVRLACCVAWISLSQRYGNGKLLISLILSYAALRPPEPERGGWEAWAWPNLALIRYQIVIVYFFSVWNKLWAGFQDGLSLISLFELLERMPRIFGTLPPGPILGLLRRWPALAPALGCAVAAVELLISFLLLRRPALGLRVLIGFHIAVSLFVGTWAFTLAMVAGGVLFLSDLRGDDCELIDRADVAEWKAFIKRRLWADISDPSGPAWTAVRKRTAVGGMPASDVGYRSLPLPGYLQLSLVNEETPSAPYALPLPAELSSAEEMGRLLRRVEGLCRKRYGPGRPVFCGFAVLAPHAEIPPHRDMPGNIGRTYSRRLHVPLFGADAAVYTIGGKTFKLEEGGLYALNNRVVHSVRNAGDGFRVNLMVDYLSDGEGS